MKRLEFLKLSKFKDSFKRTDKYLTKEQQIRRGFLKGLSISIVLVLALILLYQFLIIPRMRNEERKNIVASMEKEELDKKPIYRLNKDLVQGSVIKDEDLALDKESVEELPSDVITDRSAIVNKILRLDMKSNVILTNSMVTPSDIAVSDDLRKQDYSHITLNKDLKKGDYVDIRLKMKNGADFIVSAKKEIDDLRESIMFIRITEEERIYLNNATVVASLSGATLYTTVYVDPENQPKAVVTYQVDQKVSKMIEENANLVKQAQQEIINRNLQADKSSVNGSVPSVVSPGVPKNNNSSNNEIQDTTSASRPASIEGGI